MISMSLSNAFFLHTKANRLMVFYNYIMPTSHIDKKSLSFTSTRLSSEMSCQRKLTKNQVFKLGFRPGFSSLQVKDFISAPHRGPLTHYQTTNFRHSQTDRVCRRKWKKDIQTGRKHYGRRTNCSLRAISPFPTVFSKGLFPRGIKRRHCVGMG